MIVCTPDFLLVAVQGNELRGSARGGRLYKVDNRLLRRTLVPRRQWIGLRPCDSRDSQQSKNRQHQSARTAMKQSHRHSPTLVFACGDLNVTSATAQRARPVSSRPTQYAAVRHDRSGPCRRAHGIMPHSNILLAMGAATLLRKSGACLRIVAQKVHGPLFLFRFGFALLLPQLFAAMNGAARLFANRLMRPKHLLLGLLWVVVWIDVSHVERPAATNLNYRWGFGDYVMVVLSGKKMEPASSERVGFA